MRCICSLDNCVSPLVSCRQYWTTQKESCPIHPRLQTSRFFFSKSVKKSVERGVRVLRARSARASHARRACVSASFQTFCLTARAYLNTQKYGLFCSLNIHPHCNGPYNPCYDPYGPYGLKNGIQSVKGCLRSVNCIIVREGIYGLSVRTTVLLKAETRLNNGHLLKFPYP